MKIFNSKSLLRISSVILIFSSLILVGCLKNSNKNIYHLVEAETQKKVVLSDILMDSVTTYILVRHAEKELNVKDPGLTRIGLERALELERVLRDIDLDRVYSSDYKRTKLTASPAQQSKDLKLNIYNPKELRAFADKELSKYVGKKILIVGHSNSTPDLLNVLTRTKSYNHLPESDYDNLYVVLHKKENDIQVVHLNFGVITK